MGSLVRSAPPSDRVGAPGPPRSWTQDETQRAQAGRAADAPTRRARRCPRRPRRRRGRHAAGTASQRREPVAAYRLFFSVGSLVLVLADYLVLRSAFSSLEQLRRAMAATHMGGHGRSVPPDTSDPDLRTVSDALAEMVERIAGESRAYSSMIFESIEDERRRIGRELHDETSQSLAAALLNSTWPGGVSRAAARRSRTAWPPPAR